MHHIHCKSISLVVRTPDKLRAWAFEVLTTEIYGKLNLTIIASPTIPIVAPHLSDQAKILGESNSLCEFFFN